MTIEEIDKEGYKVKFIKRTSVTGRGVYFVALLQKNKKLYVSWKPDGHKEYTKPFFVSKVIEKQ